MDEPAALAEAVANLLVMCRSIKPLFHFDPPASEEEVRAAALQFVRKVSGFHKPSKANEEPFNRAVGRIAEAAGELIRSLETSVPLRIRETRQIGS